MRCAYHYRQSHPHGEWHRLEYVYMYIHIYIYMHQILYYNLYILVCVPTVFQAVQVSRCRFDVLCCNTLQSTGPVSVSQWRSWICRESNRAPNPRYHLIMTGFQCLCLKIVLSGMHCLTSIYVLKLSKISLLAVKPRFTMVFPSWCVLRAQF
jgi:hypothetical protein